MNENASESLPFESPDEETRRLREENARLRRALTVHGIPIPPLSPANPLPAKTVEAIPLESKEDRARKRIALFRSLFRGREDVYARRWESADGRSGYVPVALKDWKAINRSRPEDRKRVDQKTRKFFPLTDAVVEDHLLGNATIGIYPLLPDETCWFLAVDFDKKTWEYDSFAFLATCQQLNIPAALERSRSGKGGHIWIFFDRALPAITARKLGCLILTQTMERRHQIGLDSYDRFFPNQDTMPKGGLGNLIALPLQFTPRKSGNSVFIDTDLHLFPDQWQFLSTIRRLPASAADEIVAEAQRKGDLIGVRISIADDEDAQDPWTLPPSRKRKEQPIEGPLPERVQVVRSNLIYVEKKDLPPAMLNRVLRLAAFQNPEFYKAQAMR
ncbi:MAG: restriction endonuclease subunit R, partial [Nitrospiraceae bacterium]